MLEKLATIADLADRHGEYQVADDLTQLMKSAQLFDALRTLLNPAAGELGEDEGFWKRLTRGWRAGKFDRRLGLALAINEEREKLNKQILNLAQPLKEFSDQMTAFYEKVKSGGENYTSQDFKSELSSLKERAGQVKRLIDSRKLRKALDQRNRLNAQQISAIEKIKGIDESKKQFLIKILRGEITPEGKATPDAEAKPKDEPSIAPPSSAPAASPSAGPSAAAVSEKDPKGNDVSKLREWLATKDIEDIMPTEGAKTRHGRGSFIGFWQLYGYNVYAINRFFSPIANKALKEARQLGLHDAFFEMIDRARRTIIADDERSIGEHRSQKSKAEETTSPPVVEPAASAPAAVVTPPPAASPATPAPAPVVAPSPVETIPLLSTPPAVSKAPSRTKRDIELATELAKVERGKGKGKGKAKPGPTVPEEKTPRTVEKESSLELVSSAVERTERQITRFARMQQLRKLAGDLEDDDLTAEDYLQRDRFKDYPLIGDAPQDIMNVFQKGRETYDETVHPDLNIEGDPHYPDEDDWTEEYDMRIDPNLTPEDDDYEPQRPQPVRSIGKEEKLEQLGLELHNVQRALDNFRHSRDNEIGDYYREQDLKTRKRKLLKQIQDLTGLPESWIRTSSRR